MQARAGDTRACCGFGCATSGTFVLVQAASPVEQCTRHDVMKPPWPTVEFINGCSALRNAVPAVTCHIGVINVTKV